MEIFYFVQYEKSGLPLRVTINDVILHDSPTPNAAQSGDVLNMWVRPGKNRVRLSGAPPSPAPAPLFVRAQVLRQEGQDPSQRRVLAEVLWPPPDAGPSALDEELTFVAEPPPPQELWSKAQVIALEGGGRDAVLAVVGELHQAVAARNVARMFEVREFQSVDTGRSLYIPPETARASGRELLEEAAASGAWKVAPFDPAHADIRLVEDGLLAEVTVGGKFPIRIAMGQASFEIPVYVAQVDGRWIIAR